MTFPWVLVYFAFAYIMIYYNKFCVKGVVLYIPNYLKSEKRHARLPDIRQYNCIYDTRKFRF